jgi:hypothetical protein
MSLHNNLNLADWPLLPEPRLPEPRRPHYQEKKRAALFQVDGMDDLESEDSEEEGFGYDEEEEEVGEEMSEEGGNEAGQREGRVRGKDLAWLKIHEL